MKQIKDNKHGLIGHSGFVGSTLKKQHVFNSLFRSSDIETIQDQEFELLVCAGAQAKKWMANKNPNDDLRGIQKLMNALSRVRCKKFILISTVDVFSDPLGKNELSDISIKDLHPYGLHRRELELFVKKKFDESLIIRLPGLVGAGLKKNIIYDFLNKNDLNLIDSRNTFQFYPVVNLWMDIQIALGLETDVVHLTAEPLSVAEISSQAFGFPFTNKVNENYISYDFQTIFSEFFGGKGSYTYSKRESIQAIRFYAQNEPITKQLKS